MTAITQQEFFAMILKSKGEMGPKGSGITLPPPSMLTLKNEYIDYEEGLSLTAKVPFQNEFRNPVGYYQGGILAGAVDDVFGPLSYLTAQNPCVTLDYNIKFHRPFTDKDGEVKIKATVLSKTKSLITMEAKVTNPEGKLIASAAMTSMILKE